MKPKSEFESILEKEIADLEKSTEEIYQRSRDQLNGKTIELNCLIRVLETYKKYGS